jgi:hypothetical protein
MRNFAAVLLYGTKVMNPLFKNDPGLFLLGMNKWGCPGHYHEKD